MKTPIVCICCVVATFQPCLLAQDSSAVYDLELSGSVGYSYSDQTQPHSYPSVPDYSIKTHQLSLYPTVGYFFCPSIESILEFHYSYGHITTSYPAGFFLMPPEALTTTTITQSLGFGLGCAYNTKLGQMIVAYGGAMVRVSWISFESDFTLQPTSSQWSRPAVSIPVLFLGAKLFISSNWSILFRVEYENQRNVNGVANAKLSEISLLGGLAVYL